MKSESVTVDYFALTNRSSTNFLKSTFFSCGVVSNRLSRTGFQPFEPWIGRTGNRRVVFLVAAFEDAVVGAQMYFFKILNAARLSSL